MRPDYQIDIADVDYVMFFVLVRRSPFNKVYLHLFALAGGFPLSEMPETSRC